MSAWLRHLTWIQGCMLIMGALFLFCAAGIAVDIWRTRRRDRRYFAINPLFRVGGDVKERR